MSKIFFSAHLHTPSLAPKSKNSKFNMATNQPATISQLLGDKYVDQFVNLQTHVEACARDVEKTYDYIHTIAYKRSKNFSPNDHQQLKALDSVAQIQTKVKSICEMYRDISSISIDFFKLKSSDAIRSLMIEHKNNVKKVQGQYHDQLRMNGKSAKSTTKPKSDAASKSTTKPKFDPATKPAVPTTDSTTDHTSTQRNLDVSKKPKSKLTTKPKPAVPTTDSTTDSTTDVSSDDDDDDALTLGRPKPKFDTQDDLLAMADEINARQRARRQLAVPAEDPKSPAESSVTQSKSTSTPVIVKKEFIEHETRSVKKQKIENLRGVSFVNSGFICIDCDTDEETVPDDFTWKKTGKRKRTN